MVDPDQTVGAIVRELVNRIPRGRVATYGTVARAAQMAGRPIGGARTVSWILAALKGRDNTPWHRVVGAGGVIRLPDRRGALQRSRLKAEGVRFTKGVIEPDHLADETVILGQGHPPLAQGLLATSREEFEASQGRPQPAVQTGR